MNGRSADTYLFIDGEYLRRIFSDVMRAILLCEITDEDVNHRVVMQQARAKRAFFYDCVDDEKQRNERDADFEARVLTQENFFKQLGEIKGFHIRQGSLRGIGKRRRQKEVDVLLATDMLTHGYDGNMETAVLIAGDLDFRPVVESLVRRGVFVEVWYEASSASVDLPGAADYGRRLSFHDLYNWTSALFQANHQLPIFSSEHAPIAGGALVKRGRHDGREVLLVRNAGAPGAILRLDTIDGVRWYEHDNPDVLERFVPLVHGPIDWQ
jgi:uncharacterized LabA/DUF88 family protein